MAVIRNVVLLGASGILGSAILEILRARQDFTVTVLSRKESQATFPDGVKVIRTDYSQSELHEAFKGQHAVIGATGLAAISHQKVIIDACTATGVYRYVTNDFGNPPDFKGLQELEFARVPKQEILAYVQDQAEAHQPFTWTALATGHFLDYAIKKFPAFGFNLAERSARLVDDGTEPFSSTTLRDIGLAVAGILSHPEATANKYLLVRTLETTQRHILTAFERQTGTRWEVTHISSGELVAMGRDKIARGERVPILDFLPAQIFEKGAGRSSLPRERYDNDLLGVAERGVDEVVRDVLASVGGATQQ